MQTISPPSVNMSVNMDMLMEYKYEYIRMLPGEAARRGNTWCMPLYPYSHAYASMYQYLHAHTRTCIRVLIQRRGARLCIHIHMPTLTRINTYTHIRTRYTCLHLHVHIRTCTYVHVYIHTRMPEPITRHGPGHIRAHIRTHKGR